MNHQTTLLTVLRANFIRALSLVGCVATLDAASAPEHAPCFASLPMAFEANRGQAGPGVGFLARGNACQLAVSPTEAVLSLSKFTGEPASAGDVPGFLATRASARSVAFHFLGANPAAPVSGLGELPGRFNYFLGNDPSLWHGSVPGYSRVRVAGVYDGIDLIYYGNQQRLEYDFVIAPHADAKRIAFRVDGADSIQLNDGGDLVLTLGADEILQPRPAVYQDVSGAKKTIVAGYRLLNSNTVSFEIGPYDHSHTLVIDPFLSYARYFGAGGAEDARMVRVGRDGSVYVAGRTLSVQLPATTGAAQTNFGGGTSTGGDAFVAKFDLTSTNSTPVFVTYLGGSTDDEAWGLALDDDGNAYITGYTDSTNFPVWPAATAYRKTITGGTYGTTGRYFSDAFVTKLAASGSNLLFSTYLGGTTGDAGYGIAVDAAQNVYVTGYADSTNLPASTGAFQTNAAGKGDGFVAKFDATGTNLVFLTYLGGTNQDVATDIAVDSAGAAYVTGYTVSRDFFTTNIFTTNAFQSLFNNTTNASVAYDAFLVKFNPGATGVVYSTYLGGTSSDFGERLAVNPATGEAYVLGSTISADFPNNRTNYFSGSVSNHIDKDVFLTKFNADGSTNYSVVFGGFATDDGLGLAVDAGGNAHFTGSTISTNFPTFPTNNTLGTLRATNSGTDMFISVINSNATAFIYSAVLGGTGSDVGRAIAVDPAGNDYVVGQTSSTNFPTLAPFSSSFGGTNDAFLVKVSISIPPALTINSVGSDLAISWPGFTPEFSLQSTTNLSETNAWTLFSPGPAASNNFHTVLLAPTNDASFFRLYKP